MPEPSTVPEACPKNCGHAPTDHNKTNEGYMLCAICMDLCAEPAGAASTATPPVPAPTVQVQAQPPEAEVKALAENFARRILQAANQQVSMPGAIVWQVEGGYMLVDRHGREAVAIDIDGALAKIRTWLSGQ